MQQVVGRCQAKLTQVWTDRDGRDKELRRGERKTRQWKVRKCKKKEAKDDKNRRGRSKKEDKKLKVEARTMREGGHKRDKEDKASG